MEKIDDAGSEYGLIGRDIGYSFSKGYFKKKFAQLGLYTHSYSNFDLDEIKEIEEVLKSRKNLKGLNVTIPYKESVIPFLQYLDPIAEAIGAVNTIKVTKEGLFGYNTDAYGFKHALLPYLKKSHKHALILGTGGASKAISYVLGELGIAYTYVSRTPGPHMMGYKDLNREVMQHNTLIVNCTPQGTFPKIKEKPAIPYEYISGTHLLFDLIYNPEKTAFLRAGEDQGAIISNGLKMLELQAEKSWEIWNSPA